MFSIQCVVLGRKSLLSLLFQALHWCSGGCWTWFDHWLLFNRLGDEIHRRSCSLLRRPQHQVVTLTFLKIVSILTFNPSSSFFTWNTNTGQQPLKTRGQGEPRRGQKELMGCLLSMRGLSGESLSPILISAITGLVWWTHYQHDCSFAFMWFAHVKVEVVTVPISLSVERPPLPYKGQISD